MNLKIWIDGSYNEKTSHFGFGAVVDDGTSLLYFKKEFPFDAELSSMRNVAGELMGAEFALDYAVSHKAESCIIYHDYMGISEWPLKKWKANKRATKDYASLFEKLSKDCAFSFVHVKGHSGEDRNEICDALAKSAVGLKSKKSYETIVDKAVIL